MTVQELLIDLCKKFPRQSAQIEAWKDDYRSALNRHQGGTLGEAYAVVMRGWSEAAFPRPAVFVKACKPRQKTSGGASLKALWDYVKENEDKVIEKAMDDAVPRMTARYGEEWCKRSMFDMLEIARNYANTYCQIRYYVENGRSPDERLKAARWKLTEKDLDNVIGRLQFRDSMAKDRSQLGEVLENQGEIR